MPSKILVGENLRLRAIEDADIPQLFAWRLSADHYEHFYEHPIVNVEQYRAWLKNAMAKASEVNFAIEHDKKLIGTISVLNIDTRNRKAELGRVLIGDKSLSGKGLGREAVQLVVEFAFGQLNMRKLYCEVFDDNPPAIKAYEGCGFKVEGTLVDEIYQNGRYRNVFRMAVIKPS